VRPAVAAVAFILAAALAAAASPSAAGSKRAAVPAAAARDSAEVVALLGGALNAACPVPGLATAGQVDTAAFRALAAAGFRTVVDARMPAEPQGFDPAAAAKAAGLAYVALPVSPATLVDGTFDAFRALMRDEARQPALAYCSSGNRVGALMVPWLVLDRGWPLERALETAARGGMRTGPVRDRAVDYVNRRLASK
jgi:uncharacterized protein (TIGR01244 family)